MRVKLMKRSEKQWQKYSLQIGLRELRESEQYLRFLRLYRENRWKRYNGWRWLCPALMIRDEKVNKAAAAALQIIGKLTDVGHELASPKLANRVREAKTMRYAYDFIKALEVMGQSGIFQCEVLICR